MSAKRQLHTFSGAGSTSLCREATLICITHLVWKTLKLFLTKRDFVLMQKHKFWILWNRHTQCWKLSQSRSCLTRSVMPQITKRWSHECIMMRKMPMPAPNLLPLIRNTQWWPEAPHIMEFLTSQRYQIFYFNISENPAAPPAILRSINLSHCFFQSWQNQSSAFHHSEAQFVQPAIRHPQNQKMNSAGQRKQRQLVACQMTENQPSFQA